MLSHDHEWVEITIHDNNIPSLPISEDVQEVEQVIPICSIDVTFNNEEFLQDRIYALGETAPYTADSGFRFAVPTGFGRLIVNYYGCEVNDSVLISKAIGINLEVAKNKITSVYFDGDSLVFEGLEPNDVTTLDSLNKRLVDIESLLKK